MFSLLEAKCSVEDGLCMLHSGLGCVPGIEEAKVHTHFILDLAAKGSHQPPALCVHAIDAHDEVLGRRISLS